MSFLSVANDRFGHKARHSPFTNDLFGHKAIQRRRKGGPLASQNGQNFGGFGGQGPPDPPNWRSAPPPLERSAPLEIFFSGPLRQSVSSSKIIHKMHSEKKNKLFISIFQMITGIWNNFHEVCSLFFFFPTYF